MNKQMQRDEALKHLSILDFMIRDLSLYLNLNPNDTKALSVHATVTADAEKLRNAYEAEFGPLCIRSQPGGSWTWISDPWPWEVAANFEM